MPREFKLPELAESVVEGEIVRWLVAEGEPVEEDQPVVEVMTDKVTVELPSPATGVLRRHVAKEGEVVSVHQTIALIEEGDAAEPAGEEEPGAAEAEAGGPEAAEPAAPTPDEGAEDEGDRLSLFRAGGKIDEGPVFQVRKPAATRPGGAAPAAAPADEAPAATGPFGRVLAVPAARKLARELGMDVRGVPGSGPNGRIRVEDVRAHAQRRGPDGAARPQAGAPTASRHRPLAGYEDREERVPVRGLRRAISRQMMASHLETVRALHVDEADVTDLVALRKRLKPRAEARGVRLSYIPFVMKAVVAALRAFPMINASLDEEAGEIVRKHYYHLGMAVATEQGLVVPVVHDVDRLSILEIAAEVERLAAAARENRLTQDDVRGGTFSITNIGSVGGLFSFPIINVPEAAILGVHSIQRRPVVLDDDRIVPRDMLYLSLSFDHRLVDGAEASRFTSAVIDVLEAPESLLLDL